jgi:hypothetical protein
MFVSDNIPAHFLISGLNAKGVFERRLGPIIVDVNHQFKRALRKISNGVK